MNSDRIRELGNRRTAARAGYRAAHRELLDAVVDELRRDPAANTTQAARDAGLAKATIYNELTRRGGAP
jgi:hypothetical protein